MKNYKRLDFRSFVKMFVALNLDYKTVHIFEACTKGPKDSFGASPGKGNGLRRSGKSPLKGLIFNQITQAASFRIQQN